MIDPKRIRESYEEVKRCLENRKYPISFLEEWAKIDTQWREATQAVEALRHERNEKAPKGKPSPEEMAILQTLAQQIKDAQVRVQELETELEEKSLYLPNILDASTPVGNGEDDNQEHRVHGDIPVFDFEPKPHEELGLNLGLFDFESAAKIAGARFTVLKGMGAKLERAVTQFMLDTHGDSGYLEMMPPVLVNSGALRGTGQLPKFADDSFRINDTDYWLSPTAEVQLTNYYQNEIIDEDNLPLRLTAHTPCFRKEAGSYGKDMKGIIRQHQFNKVELVQFCTPESSAAQLEELTNQAESILKALKLPYRVMRLCSADIGFSAAKTYDLEVWFPSQNKYREISSCSNFFDFQARRAMIRFRERSSKKVRYLHTLNGSGLAVGRTVAAILENYQNADGSVTVPDVLQAYVKERVLR